MKRFKCYFGALLVTALMLLLAGTFTSYAIDKPNPPKNLTASIEDTDKDVAVKLEWERDTAGTQPTNFIIYMAPKDSDDPTDFRNIATLKNEHNIHFFHFYVHQLHSGHYSFYVTAVVFQEKQKFESYPSNIVKIEVVQKPFLHVLPAELLRAKKGENFNFKVKAESNIDCPILFALIGEIPEGMTIDEHDGNVNWVPQKTGFLYSK